MFYQNLSQKFKNKQNNLSLILRSGDPPELVDGAEYSTGEEQLLASLERELGVH